MRLAIPVLLLPAALGLSLACGGKGNSSVNPPAPRAAAATRCPAGPRSFTYKPGAENILFFAVQDGSGPWTAVAPVAGAYTFTLAQGKGAVARVTKAALSDRPTVHLIYGSTSRIGELGVEAATATDLEQTVRGTVRGVQAGDQVSYALKPVSGCDLPVQGGSWTLNRVPGGPNDLLAMRKVEQKPLQIFAHRNLAIEPPATPGPLDLGERGEVDFSNSSRTANLIQGHQFTLSGSPEPGWTCDAFETFRTGRKSEIHLAAGTSTMPIYFAPAAFQAPDDRHVFTLRAHRTGSGNARDERQVELYRTTPGNVSLGLQPGLTLPGFSTTASSPYPLVRIQCAFTEFYTEFVSTLDQPDKGWKVRVGASYGTGDVTLPDLSALAGWNPAWGLTPGQEVSAAVRATGRTWAAGLAPDGGKAYSACRVTTFIP